MATKKVRVLRAMDIGGLSYQADDVVVLEAELAKAHEDDGVDVNAAAVAYCEKDLGAKPIDHAARIAADRKAADKKASKPAG